MFNISCITEGCKYIAGWDILFAFSPALLKPLFAVYQIPPEHFNTAVEIPLVCLCPCFTRFFAQLCHRFDIALYILRGNTPGGQQWGRGSAFQPETKGF